ncbi:MAG: WD40/YVTN/BNR-like repeat-containing protein [Gemmatimonadota bacterium]
MRLLTTLAVVWVFAFTCSTSLGAQSRPAPAQPQFKGLLEPVSYTEDLDLTHVFFVNADVGWVAGKSGTILRTTDAGKTWEAQLGGDPADRSAPVRELHFLDERRGWAVQGEGVTPYKTLHTRDGESWEEIGTAPHGAANIVFTSPQTGFLTGNPSMSVSGSDILYRTTDGGRTWKPVWTCSARVSMGGLNQNIGCVFGQIRFPSPLVGYVMASRGCIACGSPPLIGKTTDGGDTWTMSVGPGVLEEDEVAGISFLDEQTGFARLASKKLHMTTDGGASWRGIVASPSAEIQFADPQVGWGIELGYTDLRLAYTTDGGRRWTSRESKLPATIRAFSLPRRDRAYIVGSSGMVFRYSVVPAAQPAGPNDRVLPAMPGFDSPIDEQVAQLEQVVDQLEKELEAVRADSASASAAGAGATGGAGAGTDSAGSVFVADSAAAAGEPFDAPLPPPSEFTAACCNKSFSRLEVVLGALAQTLPDFIGKYRNLNLLLAAVRMGAEMPSQYRTVKGGLRSFRKAQDRESAQAALASVSAALAALRQTTAVSMQQQLPPPPTDDSGPNSSAPSVGEMMNASSTDSATKGLAIQGAGEVKGAARDSAKAVGKDAAKAAADKAKKALGGLLRKKP